MQDPGDGAGSVESGGDLVDGYGQVGECRLIGDLRSEQTGVHRAKGHAAELGAFEQGDHFFFVDGYPPVARFVEMAAGDIIIVLDAGDAAARELPTSVAVW